MFIFSTRPAMLLDTGCSALTILMPSFSLASKALSLSCSINLCDHCFLLYSAWTVPRTLLDSDASSELILAEKLSREGGIVSSSWFYSTELRVIYNQLVYAPLFRLTSDWSVVRAVGSIIIQLLLLSAYGYLAYQAGMGFLSCFLGKTYTMPSLTAFRITQRNR